MNIKRLTLFAFLLFIALSVGLYFYFPYPGPRVDQAQLVESRRLQQDKASRVHDFLIGEAIFNKDCNSCHIPSRAKHSRMDRVIDRWGKDNIALYLQKEDSLLQAKEQQAIHINSFGTEYLHAFELSTNELKCLFEYLK